MADREDSAVGFDRAPDRYSSEDRETIDRQRDQCHVQAVRMIGIGLFPDNTSVNMLADAMFTAHCTMCAMKYDDRNGLKDDPGQESSKSKWYQQMRMHVFGGAEDPRSGRDVFEPYKRPPMQSGLGLVELFISIKEKARQINDMEEVDFAKAFKEASNWLKTSAMGDLTIDDVRPKGDPVKGFVPPVKGDRSEVCDVCGWSDGKVAMGANCNHENSRIRLSCISNGCNWWHPKNKPYPKTCPRCHDGLEWDEE